ncbi:putative MAP protein kinase [Leptomonas pyrrhocoris]|uniref:mitogen-activated protein kinase kinase n=1 Tax=Leptomonas pyrrhocoris TaxID=157538 RepID=A0A0N0VDB1_LEPPY|nr:putative MAP protein kinase [Leptomonas pyrrhocoris]KPA74832.1 putative MAP protein kinase [Leptomonas pyrrhocoris]|eukprot:XP_015653271.1 putative MAP protein kinase [Leptomonas pyrrhocoris]
MLLPMSALLTGYAVVVCIALLSSSAVLSVRMSASTTRTALQLSISTLARYVESTAQTHDALQMSSSRIAYTLEHTTASASLVPFDAPLVELDVVFELLRPPTTVASHVAQEEVWWSAEETALLSAGCYRDDTTCFRSNGTVTDYVTRASFDACFDYAAARRVHRASRYHSLHVRMMRQPQFAAGNGLWTPQVARYTERTDAVACGRQNMEYVMAYYECLTYAPVPAEAPRFALDPELPSDGVYCTHAVVSVVDVTRCDPGALVGLTTESTVMVQSLRVLDEVKNSTCTQQSDEHVAALAPMAERLPMAHQVSPGRWITSRIDGDNVVTEALLKRDTGVVMAYRDFTPTSFFFPTSESDLVSSVVIAAVALTVVAALTFFMWWRVSRPLQLVCLSMKKTTMGIIDDEGSESERGVLRERTRRGNFWVREVLDLYETYNSLRAALSELKAFSPQGLFVTEHEVAAAATQRTALLSSSSSLEMAERLPGPQNGVVMMREASAQVLGEYPDRVMAWGARLNQEHSTRGSAAAAPVGARAQSTSVPTFSPLFLPSPALERGQTTAGEQLTPLPLPLLPPSGDSHRPSETSTSSFLSPYTAVMHGGVMHLDFPALPRTTSFRTVNCTTLTVSYRYAARNLELACGEVRRFMEMCMDLILLHSGTVEVFRPDVLVVSFGAHREDPLHTKRALQCAVRIFSRFTPEQQKRLSLLLDTGNVSVGTCGAHDRYARVIAGERVDFVLRLRQHSVLFGRIITTDSIVLSWHTRKYVFLPFDSIVPRGGLDAPRTSITLFLLLPKESLCPAIRQLITAYHEVFVSALDGLYEVALEQLRPLPSFDPPLRAAFTDAIHTLLSLSPRRPRYCRFELPPFETLGYTVTPPAQQQTYKPLLVHDLEPHVPRITFLSANEPALNAATSSGGLTGPTRRPSAHERPARGLSGSSCASLDRSLPSSATDNFVCGDPTPHSFQDSKGEQWTLVPECVGRGAFSQVYKAVSSDGVIMAVKCIQLARHDVRMTDVVEEVNTSCQLWSEYIVNCISWSHVGTYLFIVMEFLAGGSLHDLVRHFPRGLSDTVGRRYASDVLRGLSYLHRHSIVHADVKPHNMLLATDGGCRISDFGSSVTKSSALLNCTGDVSQLRGTPLYMSPEVARGEPPTMKSDVWSFGLSLYEVMTGRLPWVWRSTGATVYPAPEAPRPTVSHTPRRQPHQHLRQSVTPAPPGNDTSLFLPPVSVCSCHSDVRGSANRGPLLPCASPPVSSSLGRLSASGRAASLGSTPPVATAASTPSPTTTADLKTLSATAFLRGVIRGDIVVQVDPACLCSLEAQQVAMACLRAEPAERATVEELLFMPFFYC